MATSIKTIKSQLTDDTIYPITKANAVYLANSTAQTVDGHLTSLEALVGTGSISNVGSSITGAIGNNTLATTAQTLSGAINELNSNLNNNFNFSILSSHSYKASSTNYENVGCDITIPTGKVGLCYFHAVYSSGAPIGVIITNTNSAPSSAANIVYKKEFSGAADAYGMTPVLMLAPGTYYFWVKRATVPGGNNGHFCYGIIFTNP